MNKHIMIGGIAGNMPGNLGSKLLKTLLEAGAVPEEHRAELEKALAEHDKNCPNCTRSPMGKVGVMTENEIQLQDQLVAAEKELSRLDDLFENSKNKVSAVHSEMLTALEKGPIPIPVEIQQRMHEALAQATDLGNRLKVTDDQVDNLRDDLFTAVTHRLDIDRDAHVSLGKIDRFVKMTKAEAERYEKLTWEPLHPEDPENKAAE